jgi:rhodanese-related sulfurtransferase
MNFFQPQSFFSFILKTSLAALLMMSIIACQAQKVTEADFHAMLEDMYEQTIPLLKSDEVQANYILLDTREKEEYDISHLPGAIWVGYDDFQEERIDSIAKDQPVLVYCSVGYRSERIGERMKEQGFTQVYNLYGGIFDWVNNDNEVLDKNGKATEKVHTYNKRWSRWLFKGEKVW